MQNKKLETVLTTSLELVEDILDKDRDLSLAGRVAPTAAAGILRYVLRPREPHLNERDEVLAVHAELEALYMAAATQVRQVMDTIHEAIEAECPSKTQSVDVHPQPKKMQ